MGYWVTLMGFRFRLMGWYDKMHQSVASRAKQSKAKQSKAKQSKAKSMDHHRLGSEPFRACDWSMLCFALLCSYRSDALCHRYTLVGW